MALDCFFAVWFVVGNVWIFGGHSSPSDAPKLYRYIQHNTLYNSNNVSISLTSSNITGLYAGYVLCFLPLAALDMLCHLFYVQQFVAAYLA